MATTLNTASATPESVWAFLRELAERQAENERILKESRMETDRILTEKFAEVAASQTVTDRQIADFAKSQAKTENFLKNLGRRLGGMGNSHGSFAEEYFFNAFEDGETDFFGEKFDEIEKNLKYKRNGLKDEYLYCVRSTRYDVVMFNHSSVAIIEVKYRADEDDLPAVLKKVDTFRKLAPEYKNFKIYLGYASMSFTPQIEQVFEDNGIAVIKQVGDKVIINHKKLKAF